ncbi:cyclic nucleotide-binding-like protein [Catenaria anguillulae PL171]|uniref:Cyclic nucleotide-binding-like protein n=1 Tax=Catenaria anguillulae PL171 TaxID=765915 RepID=A0A1Y2HH87_9FUNG|nr:cyclic nucleotide-binding-like protein [Catenaria anguillulae PL171]
MLGQYMIKQQFPVGLQVKVLDQEEFEWIHAKGLNTEQIFLQLPRPLRLEVYVHLYYQLVSSVPVFKNTDDLFKVALCERISMITVRAGFYICKAGDQGDEMYFIRRGKVDIYTRDETKLLVSLGAGAFFGEVALYMESTRSATAKTAMDSELVHTAAS